MNLNHCLHVTHPLSRFCHNHYYLRFAQSCPFSRPRHPLDRKHLPPQPLPMTMFPYRRVELICRFSRFLKRDSQAQIDIQEVQLTPPLKSSSKRAPLYSSLPPNVSAALPAKPKYEKCLVNASLLRNLVFFSLQFPLECTTSVETVSQHNTRCPYRSVG